MFVGGVRYVGCVAEVEINTPRGLTLRGTFVNPVDSTDAAVLFSHAFLCDRMSSPHFPLLAAKYRSLGYATLIFDYSGHGSSDDDPITSEARVEDLRAVSGWLEDQGFRRQILHAHSSGSISALRAAPRAVQTMLLSSPVMGPLDFDWEAIFSPEQLEDLEKRQETLILEDMPSGRSYLHVTPQTLIDLSLNTPESLLADVTKPIALVYDRADVARGMDDGGMEAFPLLQQGSRLDVVQEGDFSSEHDLSALWAIAKTWAERQVPVRTRTQ